MTNGDKNSSVILVVDDVPDTLELLANWLELHNFNTLRASSGQQALDLAVENLPDLILLDVMMPRMDGIETCRLLKANDLTAGIPVILVTAKDPSDARAEGMIAGAVDYITKPVNLQDLTSRVENALMPDRESPVDIQRLLEEMAHTALAILGSAMVWLLAQDDDRNVLVSRALVTNRGSRDENLFLLKAGHGEATPRFSIDDGSNPLIATLTTRKSAINVPAKRFRDSETTAPLAEAIEHLHLSYLTLMPLIATGKTVGVMVMGYYQPQNMESPRAQQILSSFGSQAAIALDYLRLVTDLQVREQERQTEQAFRKMILDTMSDALIVIDSKGIIRYVNRRMLRISNYPAGSLEGRIVGEIFHPDDREEVMDGLLRENATTMRFDQRLVTHEGKIIPVLLSRSRSQSSNLNHQVIVLSDMTDQKEREEALQRQTSRLMALNKAAQTIAANLSLHDTLKDILDSATQVVEAQGASLFLMNRDNPDELLVVAAVGYRASDLIGLRVPVGEGLAGWVARNAESQLVTNMGEDPRFYKAVDEQTGMNTQSLIAVPLIHAEQVIGVIEVVNKLNNQIFNVDDMRLLESMAGTAAVSIVNARLFDQSQRRVVELGTLLGASEAASSTLDFAVVLQKITHRLTRSLDVGRCIVMSWNSVENQLESLAEVSNVTWSDGSGPLWALSSDATLRTALASGGRTAASLRDPQISPTDRALLEDLGMTSMLALPIIVQGAVIGAVALYSNQSPGGFRMPQMNEAAALLEEWLNQMPGASNLTQIAAADLAALVEPLARVDRTCWVMVFAANPAYSSLQLVCESGFAEWTRRAGSNLPIEHYPTLQAVIEEKRIQMVNLDALAGSEVEHKWLASRGGRSCLVTPLLLRGDAVGVVMLIDSNDRLFEDEEVNLAQGIANVVSNALENARLYQSLQSRAKALESAYEELQAADQAKDQFIRNISHELRTPLMHALGYAELMLDTAFGSITSEQQDALRIITDKSHKVAEIVKDMVSVHAQETQILDRQPVDLVSIIAGILETHRGRIEESGLQLVTHFQKNLSKVLADPNKIGEAFEKLLDNALKFGGDGERLEVLVRETEGPYLQVAIRDYGIGIDPSEHQKIFQRFYQVDGGPTRRYGGTGLGLAVAKLIVEGHSGKIGVRSHLKEGSIFYFTLPKYDIMQST